MNICSDTRNASAVTDVDRVARWVYEQHGMHMEPLPCDGVGWSVGGRMTAGLIWYPRAEGGAWCHIAVKTPSLRFAHYAAQAVFAHHDELWFEVPAANSRAIAFVRRLGAQQSQVQRRTEPDFVPFFVRLQDLKWLHNSRPH